MMTPKTTVFCNNIGTYKSQLTKRKAYVIEAVNSENVRIQNDQGKLKWYASYYFDLQKEPEIQSISIDDPIENPESGLVEVTIEFSDGDRYWTKFTTPMYLNELLKGQNYLSMQKMILVTELSEERIKEVILELDEQNELRENCLKY